MSKNRFSGKSISEIYSMSLRDFSQLNKSELRQAVSRLSSAANKRLKRLAESSVESLSARTIEQSGGKFSTRGKGLDELRAEFMRVKDFLKSPTSTVKGARQAEKDAIQAVKDIYGEDLAGRDIKKMLDDFYKLQDYDEEYQAQKLRYGHLLDENVNEYSTEELEDMRRLSRRLIDVFNRNLAPGGMSYDGVSQWFDIG